MKSDSRVVVWLRMVAAVGAILLACLLWPPALQSAIAHAYVFQSPQAVALRLSVVAILYGLALAAVLLAACCSRRLRWGLFLWFLVSLLANVVFYRVAGHLMGYTDWVILWLARANAGDALGEYLRILPGLLWPMGLLALGFVLMPVVRRRVWPWAVSAGVLSVAGFTAFCVAGQGSDAEGLPPVTSLYGMVASAAFDRPPLDYVYDTDRRPDGPPGADHVILIVDESVRHDFFAQVVLPRLRPGIWQWGDFGIATAMANCSAASNVMLRKSADPADAAREVFSRPLIWSLAHNAGFSTWLLDAQRNGVGHDYFDARERAMIDYRPNVRTEHDTDLLAAIRQLPAKPRSFTLVVKRGPHFAYVRRYPRGFRSGSAARLNPYVRESERRMHYVNALDYQTGEFFARLSQAVLPPRTVIFYTSDHGQNVADAPGLTHCSAEQPLVDEGIVPLVVLANFPLPGLAQAAARNRDRLSQLDLMLTVQGFLGYGPVERESAGLWRTDGGSEPGFVYGSPFGYFNRPVTMMPVDRMAYRRLEDERWGIGQAPGNRYTGPRP